MRLSRVLDEKHPGLVNSGAVPIPWQVSFGRVGCGEAGSTDRANHRLAARIANVKPRRRLAATPDVTTTDPRTPPLRLAARLRARAGAARPCTRHLGLDRLAGPRLHARPVDDDRRVGPHRARCRA